VSAGPSFLVLDVPEFAPLVEAAERRADLRVSRVAPSYLRVEGETSRLTLARDETGLCEAIWYGALTAGLEGRIERFDDERLVLSPLP